jgi:glycosyltransferase involved in cell wall biosynthesis
MSNKHISSDKKLRIIHVLHSHGYGGAENHVIIMMRGQIALGHEVMFVGPLDSWLGEACQAHGIPATHLRMSGLFDVLSHWQLRRIARRFRADVIHGHLIRGSFYAGLAGHMNRRPLAICSAHTTNALKHMGRCRHIIADSQAIERNLQAHGYPPDSISVIYTGVPDAPVQDRAALRRELGLDEDTIAVVHAGRFIRDKGQDTLVAAMAQVTHPKVRLFLIGGHDTAFAEQVQAQAQDPARVTYLGFRSDVQRILQAFDIYVQPSRREGLPLAVSEAFVARLPVIASTVGGMPEVVLHEQTGLQVPPDKPPALAEAISRLAHDSELAKRLARSGRAFYEQHLTEHIMVKRALGLYQRYLSA